MTEIKDKVITKDAFALPYTIIKAKNQPTKGAIVYIHGGGLMFGKANDLSPQYIDILTEHYDLIQLSYRLLPEVSLDCIIEDVYASFDAIQSQYSNCPIFTFGRSSGAYLSLLIARDRDIDGVIDFYGYSRINTEPFKTLPPVFITHCNGDYDVPVEESEHIMNHVPHSTFERVNKNEHDFDRRPNDEAITIYRKVVDFLNAITMM
ncbi:alpha/beta hydrolase [Staphylococcus aureus]|nr:alpha/beta hydrolase [Staphylococcus aureus]